MKPLLIGLVLIAVIGGGVFLYVSKNKMMSTDVTETVQKKVDENNPFTSIKDALSKSLSLECTYKDERGIQTKTYMKAGSVRVSAESTTNDGMGNILMKDKKMYMWSDKTKTGFVYTISVPQKMPASRDITVTVSPENTENDKEASLLAQMEKYKDACKPSTVADSYFNVPTDVKFQDMSAFTGGAMKTQPSGSVDYDEYVKEMMKKIPTQPNN